MSVLSEAAQDNRSVDAPERCGLPTMRQILDRWVDLDQQRQRDEAAWRKRMGAETAPEHLATGLALSERMAKEVEPYLSAFLEDNSSRTAEELEEIAGHLSPGGAHTGGLLVRLIRSQRWDADPLLAAATIRYNWHGGKFGFQFLPDPAGTDADDYASEAADLLQLFSDATDGNPRRNLTGDDLAFFDNLPDRFTVYRGCSGLSADMAGQGVCWITQREIAEWFAERGKEPVVVTARIRKNEVRLAKADEYEVVCRPARCRSINVRWHGANWRPEMEWKPIISLRRATRP